MNIFLREIAIKDDKYDFLLKSCPKPELLKCTH